MLWAGQLPEDLDYSPHLDYFADKQLYWSYGTQDPFITEKRLAVMRSIITDSGLSFGELPYEGAHKVDRKALVQWWRGINGQEQL
jgi:predicted esterase